MQTADCPGCFAECGQGYHIGLIGYVTRDPEVIALKLADPVGEGPAHPMVLAARWMAQARCCGASPLPADVGTATMGP